MHTYIVYNTCIYMYIWLQLSELVLFGSVAHVHPVWDNQASHTLPGVLLQASLCFTKTQLPETGKSVRARIPLSAAETQAPF